MSWMRFVAMAYDSRPRFYKPVLLSKQHEDSVRASEELDDEFNDWLWVDDTDEPNSDPTLSIHPGRLAQALLAANGIEVGLRDSETEIQEGGDLLVRYWKQA